MHTSIPDYAAVPLWYPPDWDSACTPSSVTDCAAINEVPNVARRSHLFVGHVLGRPGPGRAQERVVEDPHNKRCLIRKIQSPPRRSRPWPPGPRSGPGTGRRTHPYNKMCLNRKGAATSSSVTSLAARAPVGPRKGTSYAPKPPLRSFSSLLPSAAPMILPHALCAPAATSSTEP